MCVRACAWNLVSQWVTRQVAALSANHLMVPLPLSDSRPPDQLCISVQHRQDPNDKTTSIHHVRDNPVQVLDGCLPLPRREKWRPRGPCICLCAGSSMSLPWELSPPREAPPTTSPSHPFPRKAVKATLVLLPLLGTTYMLFLVNPGEDDLTQIVFIYFNSFLQSFQVSPGLRGQSHGTGAHVGHSGTHSNVSVHTLNPTPEPRWAHPDGVWVAQLAPTDGPAPALSHLHQEGSPPALSLWGPGSECPPATLSPSRLGDAHADP